MLEKSSVFYSSPSALVRFYQCVQRRRQYLSNFISTYCKNVRLCFSSPSELISNVYVHQSVQYKLQFLADLSVMLVQKFISCPIFSLLFFAVLLFFDFCIFVTYYLKKWHFLTLRKALSFYRIYVLNHFRNKRTAITCV